MCAHVLVFLGNISAIKKTYSNFCYQTTSILKIQANSGSFKLKGYAHMANDDLISVTMAPLASLNSDLCALLQATKISLYNTHTDDPTKLFVHRKDFIPIAEYVFESIALCFCWLADGARLAVAFSEQLLILEYEASREEKLVVITKVALPGTPSVVETIDAILYLIIDNFLYHFPEDINEHQLCLAHGGRVAALLKDESCDSVWCRFEHQDCFINLSGSRQAIMAENLIAIDQGKPISMIGNILILADNEKYLIGCGKKVMAVKRFDSSSSVIIVKNSKNDTLQVLELLDNGKKHKLADIPGNIFLFFTNRSDRLFLLTKKSLLEYRSYFKKRKIE